MIITEYLENNLIKKFSDESKLLLQNESNKLFIEAIDILPCEYTYTETDTVFIVEEDPIPSNLI